MSDIKQHIRELADQLKKDWKVGSGGVIEISGDTFNKILEGSNVTEAQFKNVQKLTNDIFAASMCATGELAVAAMKKDKKLDQVSVEIPLLKDSISHVVQRSKEVMAGMPKEGEPVPKKTTFGYVTSKYINDVSGSKGEAKKVKQHIAALAEEAFGK